MRILHSLSRSLVLAANFLSPERRPGPSTVSIKPISCVHSGIDSSFGTVHSFHEKERALPVSKNNPTTMRASDSTPESSGPTLEDAGRLSPVTHPAAKAGSGGGVFCSSACGCGSLIAADHYTTSGMVSEHHLPVQSRRVGKGIFTCFHSSSFVFQKRFLGVIRPARCATK